MIVIVYFLSNSVQKKMPWLQLLRCRYLQDFFVFIMTVMTIAIPHTDSMTVISCGIFFFLIVGQTSQTI